MDQLPVGTHPRIELHGSAPSLEAFYARADFVIAPIFTGGGMKVKIAEALIRQAYHWHRGSTRGL